MARLFMKMVVLLGFGSCFAKRMRGLSHPDVQFSCEKYRFKN
jgi:hypothetical protein